MKTIRTLKLKTFQVWRISFRRFWWSSRTPGININKDKLFIKQRHKKYRYFFAACLRITNEYQHTSCLSRKFNSIPGVRIVETFRINEPAYLLRNSHNSSVQKIISVHCKPKRKFVIKINHLFYKLS